MIFYGKSYLKFFRYERMLTLLMPSGNKQVTHTETGLQLKIAGLFKYV